MTGEENHASSLANRLTAPSGGAEPGTKGTAG
jgi:hypothetical protein